MLKTTLKPVLAAALLLAAAADSAAKQQTPPIPTDEAKLIAIIKSNAGLKEKMDACKMLSRVGSKDSIPVLASLLGDEKLSHVARWGLEPNPDPAVDRVFREALGKLKGRPLVGVIGSIGVRRDGQATGMLVRFLKDADPDVAQAAAKSLGRIGTPEAAKAIGDALDTTPKANLGGFAEGLLRCAEALAKTGKRQDATAIYDRLRGLKKAPHQIRAAGLRGAILTRGEACVPLLLETVRGEDADLHKAAARAAMEMKSPAVTKALAGELDKLHVETKILFSQVLGFSRDKAAVPALSAAAKKGLPACRVAAIRAMAMIGDGSAAPVLMELHGDPEGDVAEAARNALATLPGEQVDAVLASMLGDADVGKRRLAIELIGQRRSPGAIPALMKAAGDSDETVRMAGLKALGDAAGSKEFPALVDLLAKARSAGEIQALEKALSGICTRESQIAPGSVVIHKAVYGDLPNGKTANVTKKVANMVKKGARSVEASNTKFGDPAQGTVKKLRVEFTANGKRQTKTVNEKESIVFTGAVVPKKLIDTMRAALDRAEPQPKKALQRLLDSFSSK